MNCTAEGSSSKDSIKQSICPCTGHILYISTISQDVECVFGRMSGSNFNLKALDCAATSFRYRSGRVTSTCMQPEAADMASKWDSDGYKKIGWSCWSRGSKEQTKAPVLVFWGGQLASFQQLFLTEGQARAYEVS